MKRIAVIGGGAWGSALASLLTVAGHQVTVLTKTPQQAEALKKGISPNLGNMPIAPPSEVTIEASHALTDAEAVLVVVPVAATLEAFALLSLYAPPDIPVALTAKGLYPPKGALLTELATSHLKQSAVMLCGPSFASEVAAGKPAALVAASTDASAARMIADLFIASPIRVYIGNDPAGVAVASAVKNVIAIATGITDALALGSNARAAVITRGLAEARRLTLALGGQQETLLGLAGVGDMILTCTDGKSRNYALGLALGQGEIPKTLLAEGLHTAAVLRRRAEAQDIEMPIVTAIDKVINHKADIRTEIDILLTRPTENEQQ